MSLPPNGESRPERAPLKPSFNLDEYLRGRIAEQVTTLTVAKVDANTDFDTQNTLNKDDRRYEEVVLRNVIGESSRRNDDLLNFAMELIVPKSGLIVVMNSAGPKKIGLPKTQIANLGLDEIAHVGAGFREHELFRQCQVAWDKVPKEGEDYWTHHHGFVDILRPTVQVAS